MNTLRAVSTAPAGPSTLLRCQQTLEPLEWTGSGFYSAAADLTFPVRNGLVFMGYDERDESFVRQVIEEESAHQTSAAHVERDLQFLQESSRAVVDIINALTAKQLLRPGMRGLEIGSASGWPSWLFAEAGCEMWLCELEPNSLASGLVFAHENIGEGQRVVCDATLLPFADETFDLVVCKELAHHVEDKQRLFHEANRVLRVGGLFVLFEPVRSVQIAAWEVRHPDPHFGHSIVWPGVYLRDVRAAGFDVAETFNYPVETTGRFRVLRRLRARRREAVRKGRLSFGVAARGFMWLFGGELLVAARKVSSTGTRPEVSIKVVDPELEIWTQGASYDRTAFLDELRKAARALVGVPRCVDVDDSDRS